MNCPSRSRLPALVATVFSIALVVLGATSPVYAGDGAAAAPPGAYPVFSATGLFNDGNAHVRRGDVGRAVLSYERALQLSPRDPDVAQNLAVVRREADLPASTFAIPGRAAAWLSLDEWAWLGAGALLLLTVFVLGHGIAPSFPRLPRPVLALLGILVLTSAVGVGFGLDTRDRAVVVDDDVTLHISPFAEAEIAATLPEGSVVHRERSFGDHVHVRAADGRSGWADAARIASIRPGS